ncbi:major facilitator superfamily protein [Hirsutella rhossiliensis]|uniref:Major facilitator superfamily domain-containing protein n=1 Tax=Hirsutella rhossiliensis TaxID=111463 RepID=A0A9P8N0G2_9HYPO|nr:major facilitator superfamily domain-containing protein [Hirsutella rhossiliensis]KAH0964622.1 major facilitator superfamily domain-containing protein [Hirsutella rhossiliensis]
MAALDGPETAHATAGQDGDEKQPTATTAAAAAAVSRKASGSSSGPDQPRGLQALPPAAGGDENTALDPREERRLLLKLDAFFVPIMMLLYLSCFLDRANIGNVRVAGMPEAIGATPHQFSIAVSIFYATYVAFEPPWTVMMRRLTPRLLITGLCVVWSVATALTACVGSVAGLYAVRLVLGATEAGLFPALNLYLTMVYKRDEQATRVSYLFVCAAVAGAFGGLLAYSILKMDGVAGLPGWRWVFLLEGLVSLLVAPVVWFGLPNDPCEAYFLDARERAMMRVRTAQRARYMGADAFAWHEVAVALRDPKLYLSAAIQFCQDVLLYGFSTFLPSIIVSMGYSPIQAQYLSIPVYLFGGLAFLCLAFLSDRTRLRGPFVFLANVPGIVGYLLIICSTSSPVKFFATFLCAVAVFTGPGLNLTLLNVNVAPHYRRATAIGVQLSIANSAGILAGQVYLKPPYLLGNSVSVAALGLSQIFIVLNWLYLRRCNRQKARIARGHVRDQRKVRTGDRELDFKYHL